jgi:hypothetical protein
LSQIIYGKLKGIYPFYLITNILVENFNLYIPKKINYSIHIKNKLFLVKILNNYLSNPQITTAYLKNLNKFNITKELSMLVGISETKRLLSAIIIILFKLILSFYFFFYLNLFPYESYINVFKFNIFPITIPGELNNSYDIIYNRPFFFMNVAGLIYGEG